MTKPLNWRQALSAAIKGGVPAKYRDLVKTHGRSREVAINFIEGIGGYSGGHRLGNYALSWNAKCYGVNFDMAHLYGLPLRDDFPFLGMCKNDGHRGVLYSYFRVKHAAYKEQLWEWATEEAWESFKDDDSTFWGADLDAKWHLTGRSSGHLVADTIGNFDLRRTNEDLIEYLKEKDEDRRYLASNADLAHLFLVCVQMEVDWPRKAVEAEVEYRAAWRLWAMLDEDRFKELLTVYDDPKETLESVVSEMTDESSAYDDICTLLGHAQE